MNIRRAALALLALLLFGCNSENVQLTSKLPRPLIDRIDLPVGLYCDDAFLNFRSEEELPQIGKVTLAAGALNLELFEAVLPGLFTDVRRLTSATVTPGVNAPGAQQVRAVFVPRMQELQFSLPQQTHNGNFEVWVHYRVRLQTPDGQAIAEWPIKAYGKSPDSDWNPIGARERGLQAAANVALRDAAAALTLSLRDVPEVRRWLETQLEPPTLPAANAPAP